MAKIVEIVEFLAKNFQVNDCEDDPSKSIIVGSSEVFFIFITANLLHLLLKRLGQPIVVSQMLVGIFLGPTLLGRVGFYHNTTRVSNIASIGPIVFMFMAGLEIDIAFTRSMLRSASKIMAGSIITYAIISLVSSGFPFLVLSYKTSSKLAFVIAHFIILFNTSSPVLIRVVNELKLTATPIGRLAITSVLLTEFLCLFLLVLFTMLLELENSISKSIRTALYGVAILGALVMFSFVTRMVARWVNKRNKHRNVVEDDLVCFMLLILFVNATIAMSLKFDPMMGAFLIGLAVPKDGPIMRTMMERLSFFVNNLILPVYFGYMGMMINLSMLKNIEIWRTVLAMVLMGIVGKVGATMAVAKYLKMHPKEGLVLGLLLNVKGHLDLVVISSGKQFGLWKSEIEMAFFITILANNIIICPIVTYITRNKRRSDQHISHLLENLNPYTSEYRIIACVHSQPELPSLLRLLLISTIPSLPSSIAPYIMHLIEPNQNSGTAISKLYNQLQDHDDSNNTISYINLAIDTFIRQTDINVRRFRAISRYSHMHENLDHEVHNVHASLVILPFHKRQRLLGKMGPGKDDIEMFNEKVLKCGSCSVGILVDRGNFGGDLIGGGDQVVNVMVVFIGGADDREALAFGGRLALHPNVNVTLLRIFPGFNASRRGSRRGHANAIASNMLSMECNNLLEEVVANQDEIFMSNFHDKFVVPGKVAYMEMEVDSSMDLIQRLSSSSSSQGLYSLYIVGKKLPVGPTTQLAATIMSDLGSEEFSDTLGPIGNLLTFSEFMLDTSVLVIQQHGNNAC